MAGVVLEDVSRVYPGGVVAVDQVSLEVLDREFLVLVGPSGCGKTTALRMIAGLEELSGGTIRIGGKTVNEVRAKDRDIAMVFQNYALYPHMSVYRNLAFGLELREARRGWGGLWRWVVTGRQRALRAARRYSVAERVHAAAKTLGIEELLDRLPGQLSGGQRQRVALGRAIVRDPAVFLFDEPLSNLDAKLRVEMRRELKQLHRKLQATMIYVTHDQVEALTLGQRIVVMDGGRIQQVGTPNEIYDWPVNRFVAGFIGTPAMNLIDGELLADSPAQFRRGAWLVPLAARLDGARPVARQATLGVRPEDVKLSAERTGDAAEAEGVVRTIESIGDAALVTVELGAAGEQPAGGDPQPSACVVCKSEPAAGWVEDQQVSVSVASDRVHVFDPATGLNCVRRPV